jgi:uncharacterized protein with ParB-like and HNH nuclease domain
MGAKTVKPYQYLKDLFDDNEIQKITVPSYQRAYSWEEKQLDQFIGDLVEMTSKDKKGYYFGHFIFENNNGSYDIIDGQQRITTFILFLIACGRKTNSNKFKNFIDKFSTVDYDDRLFSLIKNNETFENEEAQKTLSISKIEFALGYFEKQFDAKKLKLDSIEKYIDILLESRISTHITEDKAVAVQIFELHNSRGVKLNTIEKVKAKLMKALYLNAEKENVDSMIIDVQKSFGEIYHFEEKTSSTSFRGNLSLEEILLIHLRMIDDGTKIQNPEREQVYNSPSKTGNRDENILNYIDEKIKTIEKKNIVNYIVNLVRKFEESVKFITEELVDLDLSNPIIGDTIILDRNYSLSFFMLIKHIDSIHLLNNDLVLAWEKLLFTRNFHGNYYRLKWTDNFEYLFFRVVKQIENGSILEIVNDYKDHGFRSDYLENQDLQEVVKKYIEEHKEIIKNSAFHWHKEKMVYLLYKYEIHLLQEARKYLREIMKNGVSVEHILPQEWQWYWTIYEDNQASNEAKLFLDKIEKIKNGIGNLLIITPSQNSSLSNNSPNDKKYDPALGLSYQKHNDSNMWDDCNNWESNILTRGAEIYSFLVEFVNK